MSVCCVCVHGGWCDECVLCVCKVLVMSSVSGECVWQVCGECEQ